MKKLFVILSFAGFISIAVSSCNKKLTIEPISSITAASFWKNENDAQAGLTAMYVGLRSQAGLSGSFQYNNYFLGEARSEIMTYGTAGSTGFDIYYQNSLTANNAGPSWVGYYSIINAANLVLKYVPDITFQSGAVKNNLLAQAYTMRAYVYFIMVRTWGDLIIRTEPMESFNPEEVQKERSPKEEVFKLIKADLEKALQLFPDNSFPAGRFRWSKPASNSLKAEVYLWTGKLLNGGSQDFTTALTALNDVQTASSLSLLPNFADVFDYNKKGNNEIIMSIRLADGEGVQGYTGLMYGFIVPACTPQATKDLLGITTGTNSNHAWQLSPAARNAFTNDDLRKAATYVDLYTYNSSCAQTGYLATITLKFRGTVIGGVRWFYDDIILYRYADILLLKAEAKNALGQDPTPEMNMVRQRAYGSNFSAHSFVNGTKNQNDDAILKERLLELMVEGKRWWDLVRFGKAFQLVPSLQSRAGQDYLLLFPISNAVLAVETKVKQNPGY
ncbi:RagB/SusD family nutrient uptake outer membrane protein [Flavisolibacter ginsenosidimutans]|uniref:RagB/SusD family nutrient uptake outer membrane protein n=1 Tax=Flavisolibacter ginsenosidimutans TaxID=661481 RepID=A0A5B8UNY2_9BACT|nr:RagB/SusD family nutrient uptake outer membrane protein [Flavisolibacter ginsenosidimutans]QEC54352.1 RagB/SusD family nutrient uptake outer membrane protein [Flavisolibacter ginsenosidimutans]QEC58387.1 RagB/SusD family nutrient uptake outer membrane protein [Flavisolibacter ginsenosidimutans]